MYCNKCGKELNDDSNFCKYCGTKVNFVYSEESKIKNKPKSRKKIWISILIICVMFYILLICPITYRINLLGVQIDFEVRYNPITLEMTAKMGPLSYSQKNVGWIKAMNLRYNLIFGNSSDVQNQYSSAYQSSQQKDLVYEKALTNYIKIQPLIKNYIYDNWFKSKIDKEQSFLQLYKEYINNYINLEEYIFKNGGMNFSDHYIKQNQEKFKNVGLKFFNWSGDNCLEIDYNILINTLGIPRNWKNWLIIQQQINEKRIEIYEKDDIPEGEPLPPSELEYYIIELENVEQKSDIIKSINYEKFMYIPDTTKKLINKYLVGDFDYPNRQIEPDFKKSYKHFIDNYPKSRYYNLVKEYYLKLEKNNFKKTPIISNWLEKELKKY